MEPLMEHQFMAAMTTTIVIINKCRDQNLSDGSWNITLRNGIAVAIYTCLLILGALSYVTSC